MAKATALATVEYETPTLTDLWTGPAKIPADLKALYEAVIQVARATYFAGDDSIIIPAIVNGRLNKAYAIRSGQGKIPEGSDYFGGPEGQAQADQSRIEFLEGLKAILEI